MECMATLLRRVSEDTSSRCTGFGGHVDEQAQRYALWNGAFLRRDSLRSRKAYADMVEGTVEAWVFTR